MPSPNVPLTKANIMIDKDGNARLADFGLLTIVSDSTHPATTSSSEGAGTMRWMSPELLDPERFGSKNARPTKESDCYALGMVILEVLTGQVPFPSCNSLVVMRKIVEGERPDRPQGPETVRFTDDLWEMLQQCWLSKPKLRPAIEDVLDRLEWGSATWESPSLSADSDSQVDGNKDLASATNHHLCAFFRFVFYLHSPARYPSQRAKLFYWMVTNPELYRKITPTVQIRTKVHHRCPRRPDSNQASRQ